ncbi:MAG: pyridoxal-phosphate dependent enzyme [Flavobacteriaceae bacterium]|tara:strand:+ start:63014 stop:64048 length:1035 start_codon:yes stop_codon:yes gene_type:complete
MQKKIHAHHSILPLIGKTPLVQLHKIVSGFAGTFYAKLEAFNPGHSAKDRIALHIIEIAEEKGLLKLGDTIVETTSGNTGFSLAMISAVKGYKCILAVSSKSSPDKIDMLRAMGAVVHVCPAHISPEDPRSYYEVAKTIHANTPNSIYINQYFNSLNAEAHYRSTGPEIWKDTAGEITHLVVCSGTGGTISGTAQYLKDQNPNIQIIGVDAYGSILKGYHETGEINQDDIFPYRIEGLGKNLIPTATDFSVIDRFIKVRDDQSAHMARLISKTEGIFAGYTCGAAMQAVKQLDEEGVFNAHSKVVVIFPDHGSKYMSKIYSDEWMSAQGFLEEEAVKEKQTISK